MAYVDVEGMKQLIPINLCGDGIRKMFYMVLAIYDSRGGMVFIDEVENGLHFSHYETLWDVIFYFANLYDVQVFATTHSIETLQYLTSYLNKNDHKGYQNDFMSYTLRKLNSGEHKAYAY